MSQNFLNESAAVNYALGHDDEAKRLSRRSDAYLAVEEGRALRESGGRRVCGGPVSRDEKIASILELRWPLISEARAVLAAPEEEPGSQTVTFTFPGGGRVTVPPMAEDPRVTAPLVMSAEDMLKLVEDGSNDYVEDIGERGGYVSYSVEGDVLTVKVQAFTEGDDEDALETTERQWRLVPVDERR
jgi:hypothetical protein